MIAERINYYLDDHGIMNKFVAERSGIPLNTFSMMMNGKRKITADEYAAICRALGLSLDTFVDSCQLERSESNNEGKD